MSVELERSKGLSTAGGCWRAKNTRKLVLFIKVSIFPPFNSFIEAQGLSVRGKRENFGGLKCSEDSQFQRERIHQHCCYCSQQPSSMLYTNLRTNIL